MLKRLDTKVAVVTGAGKGIGRAVARLFARERASVLVVDVDPEAGERVEREIVEAQRHVIPLGRMADPADIAQALLFLASEVAGYITGQTLPESRFALWT